MTQIESFNHPKISRRQSLQLGAAATAAGVVAATKLTSPAQAKDAPSTRRAPRHLWCRCGSMGRSPRSAH